MRIFPSLLILLCSGAVVAHAQSTAITYQGRLNDGGSPANGRYDLSFAVFDAASGASQVSGTLIRGAVPITNGLFTLVLDFGSGVFSGEDRWLEIGAVTNGAGSFITLNPRQKLTATPYAITARGVTGVIPNNALSGAYGNAVTLNNPGNNFTGNGAGLVGVNAVTLNGLSPSSFWQFGGNTVAPGQFLGSVNNQPLDFRVNGKSALRLEPTQTDGLHSDIVNVIAGSSANSVAAGVYGATIAGGGAGSYGLVAVPHRLTADFATIGGGGGNTNTGVGGTVAGGFINICSNFAATVGGGYQNISGGDTATVGGGGNNVASGGQSTVSGGNHNKASADGSTVGGGGGNTNGGYHATIGGGYENTNTGEYATIPGGERNSATGDNSFAAGRYARAPGNGSFVWNSYGSPNLLLGPNQFQIFGQHGFSVDYSTQRPDGGGGRWLYIGDNIAGNTVSVWNGAGLTDAGVWVNASDKHRKTDFKEVDSREILERLAALPLREWRYTNENAGVKHLGPTAQDFQTAFGLGTDDKGIGTVDADGVALAAIQGLHLKLNDQRAENTELKRELATVKQLLEALRQKLEGDAP